MSKKKKSICFIDDQESEIKRFKENLGDRFIIGAGTTIDSALKDLKDKGRKKPDLYVLDMYFPKFTPPKESGEEIIKKVHQSREEFLDAKIKFISILTEAGQSPQGGFQLVEKLKERMFGKPKYVFFTRKGTLEDVQDAYDQNIKPLRIIKKPDPKKEDKEGVSIDKAYDIAFKNKNNVDYIDEKLNEIIKSISFWGRYKEYIIGFIFGLIISVIGGLIIMFISG